MIKDQKVVAIIQARMKSSRLPGKVLEEIAGYPMLYHVVNRVALSTKVDEVVVATTSDPTDDEIEVYCQNNGFSYYRGHPFDVLDRYYQVSLLKKADVVVRITADCPLMDAVLIDELLADFSEAKVDFAANRLPPPWKRSYPIGLDNEITTFSALEKAWKEAESSFEREHVMPFFYDQPGRFKVLLKHHDPDYGNKRWTVDTPQDLEFVRAVYDHFSPKIVFSWESVIDLVSENPDLEKINESVNAKNVVEVDNRFTKGDK